MKLLDRLSKKIKPREPEGTCRICDRPIFNLDSKFGRKGLCIYCNQAFEEGVEFGEHGGTLDNLNQIYKNEQEKIMLEKIKAMREAQK